jgi:hypothetical protein
MTPASVLSKDFRRSVGAPGGVIDKANDEEIQGYYKGNRHFQRCIETKLLTI